MIEAPQAQADHQHHGQAQCARQIAGIVPVAEWHQKSPGTFDDHPVGCFLQRVKSLLNDDEIDRDTRLLCCNMGRNRWHQRIGIDPLA